MIELKNQKIAAVMVTFNRLDKLKLAVKSSLEQGFDYIIITNNCSTDGTADWLDKEAKQDQRLIVLHSEENTGGAGGFYNSCHHAIENTDADWLVLFDDDAYPATGFSTKMRELKLGEDVGAICTAVRTPDNQIADFNRPGLNPFRNIFSFGRYLFSSNSCYLKKEELEFANAVEVDFSSFVGFCVRTDVMKRGLGLPRKELFIYCDDWLYSLDLTQLGYKNLYYSELLFYHDSATFIDSYDSQIWKKYYAYRNSLLFYKKTASYFFPVVFALKLLKWLLDTRLYSKKQDYLSTLFRAVGDGLKLKA